MAWLDWNLVAFDDLQGKTFTSVEKGESDDDREKCIRFKNDYEVYEQYHCQNCCESFWIEDICGDLKDLEGVPILEASERFEDGHSDDSETWSFYRISTIKGTVVIRWNGLYNGGYSETVSLYKKVPRR